MSSQNLFDTFKGLGIDVPPEYRASIEEQITRITSYQPKVGVFGKTGAGKSSLCNALFGQDVCPISDVDACTRAPQEVLVGLGNGRMTLVDVPGVGESLERDKEYKKLYKSLLPTLDLILWVLKGDDRAFSSDEKFYNSVVKPHIAAGRPFFVVINQVDKVEPCREWDLESRRPSQAQVVNIDKKVKSVAAAFDLPLSHVIAVSANEQFGLVELVDGIVRALPKDQKAVVLQNVSAPNRSKSAIEESERGFIETVIDIVVDIAPLPSPVKTIIKSVGKKLVSWAKSFWPW